MGREILGEFGEICVFSLHFRCLPNDILGEISGYLEESWGDEHLFGRVLGETMGDSTETVGGTEGGGGLGVGRWFAAVCVVIIYENLRGGSLDELTLRFRITS
jgi:hypothetical protein